MYNAVAPIISSANPPPCTADPKFGDLLDRGSWYFTAATSLQNYKTTKLKGEYKNIRSHNNIIIDLRR